MRTRNEPATGQIETVDLGFVGEPDKINTQVHRDASSRPT